MAAWNLVGNFRLTTKSIAMISHLLKSGAYGPH
jgi:hypothetical protein